MNRLFLALLFLMPSLGLAIPNSFTGGRFIGPIVPAHPRFGGNLTRPVLTLENWDRNTFPGEWEKETALAGQVVCRMKSMPVLFGTVPDSVVAYADSGKTREIVITYLDAGTYFGFKFGGEKTHEDRESGSERRSQFAHHYHQVSRDLRQRLESGCGPGRQVVMGRSDLLRSVFTEYRWEDFLIRLARRDGHSIAVHLMQAGQAPTGFVEDTAVDLTRSERRERLAENVITTERGDRRIEGIPMFTQGHTPFCGIHTLAMAGHYYGLRLRADGLAAGAEFRNTGSARGSRILELYHSVGDELGMDVKVSSRFDFDRVQRAIAEGRPVIVWRRVSQDREKEHSQFAAKLARVPSAVLPTPSRSDRSAWPDSKRKGSPSHASIVSGFNAERNEVIFTDPWGEEARGRRMSVEEMEATVYAVFFFDL